MWSLTAGLLAGLLLALGQAQIMSVDLGHEFFKVALMRQGVPLEIVLNAHSKRKTTTAVSFHEAVRVFGDDALNHQGKAPAKVPMFFHGLLGLNFTAEDIKAGGKWWDKFGLGDRFYSHKLGYEADRGVPTMMVKGTEEAFQGEEVLANIFFIAKKMAEDSGEGKAVNVRDLVVTVPSDATLRQRQAIVAAGEIAGLRALTLVHETSAFAVQRAVDFTPEKGASEVILFFNLGARKAEVSIVRFDSRQAGMVAGKMAPVVTVLGSALDYSLGGHTMDIRIAEVMLKKFQEKHPKFASSILQDPKAIRKLLSQAQKTKATLSANKAAPYIVESLHQDTDFQASIKREDFEEWCKDIFAQMTVPIDKALKMANVTLADISQVEVVGGGWRVPKVQELLAEFFEKGTGKKMPLGQHLNGEEAGAFGAALVAANSSQSFRVKKIFFSDLTHHEYSAQVTALKGSWEKNLTVLYPVGSPLGKKKTTSTAIEEDFKVKLFEDGVLITEYEVTGVNDLLAEDWKGMNMSGSPKISAQIPLETSGIIEMKTPTISVEEYYWVNVTKEKPKPKVNKTKANASSNESAESNESNETEEKKEEGDEEKKEEGDEEQKDNETSNESAETKDSDSAADSNTSNKSSKPEKEYEVTLKLKKRKHEKKLKVKRIDYKPIPLSEASIAELKLKLDAIANQEAEVQAVAGMKNELEAAIYGSRDKIEREDIVKVSTEEQRAEVVKLCTEYEEWMYEGGTSKAEYQTRLAKIQGAMAPMEERAQELEARSELDDHVAAAVKDMKAEAQRIHKDMSWVSKNKTEAAEAKLAEFQEWWAKVVEKQAALPLHEAPAYTKADVANRMQKIIKAFEILSKQKKPKEEKKKEDKKDKEKDKKGKDKDKKGKDKEEKSEKAEPLSNDPVALEKELADVRDKKTEAVEKEEFDLANSLKEREQALVKHLQKLKADAGEKDEL